MSCCTGSPTGTLSETSWSQSWIFLARGIPVRTKSAHKLDRIVCSLISQRVIAHRSGVIRLFIVGVRFLLNTTIGIQLFVSATRSRTTRTTSLLLNHCLTKATKYILLISQNAHSTTALFPFYKYTIGKIFRRDPRQRKGELLFVFFLHAYLK
jgi:hypothetical protein